MSISKGTKIALTVFAVIAFAFTLDVHAATLAVSSVLDHSDVIGGHLGAGALAASNHPPPCWPRA